MTNKTIKPFYIKDLTLEQQVKVIDKCIEAGATPYTGISSYHTSSEFSDMDRSLNKYVGLVCGSSQAETFTSFSPWKGEEITLDQLGEHLGLVDTKVTDLKNIKIDLRKCDENGVPTDEIDEELSKAFQEACFEQGIRWKWGNGYHKQVPYLFTSGNRLTYCSQDENDYYKDHKNQEITFTYKRELTWEAKHVVDEESEDVTKLKSVIQELEDNLKKAQEQLSEINK